jgi:protein-disulfide isomerase
MCALALAACVTRGEIDELKKGQDDILAKLDKIEKASAQRMPPPPPPMPRGPDGAKVYAFNIGDAAAKGPKDAWVTIVEVSDFQCPFCARAGTTLKEVETTYKDDVRFVFKHNPLPFHNRAMPAAVAGLCAAHQKKFWPLHDSMFADQGKLEDKDLEGYAKAAGVDMGKWKKCLADAGTKSTIEADIAQAAKLGARGTPAFFINGRFLSGAQPFPAFKAIIDEELKKAKDSGIAKKDYYAKAVEEKGEKSL